jgi:Disulphide bond corrector protein DsbC
LLAAPVLSLLLPALRAQTSPILSVAPPSRLTAKRGTATEAKIAVTLQEGYHVNSNTPSESYLIPLKLTWTPGPLEPVTVVYPKPRMEKYQFSATPLSVYTGNFDLVSKFKAPAAAESGPAIMVGKLRYQACNNNACFPPKTVEVKLPVEVH